MLPQIGVDAFQPRNIGLRVRNRTDLMLVDQEGRDAGLFAEHLIEGVVIMPEGQRRLRALELIGEQLKRKLCVFIQQVVIEAIHHLVKSSFQKRKFFKRRFI